MRPPSKSASSVRETLHERLDSIPPWAADAPETESRDQREQAPTALPLTPLAVEIETTTAPDSHTDEITEEPVHSSHVFLWLTLVLLFVGAGVVGVWYFFLPDEDTTQIITLDKQNEGTTSPSAPPKASVQNKPLVERYKTADTARGGASKSDKSSGTFVVHDGPGGDAGNADAGLEAYKKGNALIREGKYKEAIGEFKKALSLNPKLNQAHRGLGISFAQLRQNQQACQEYRLYRKSLPADSKELPTLDSILRDCR